MAKRSSKSKKMSSRFEVYQAKADSGIARAIAATTSPFTIEVRFLGGLTSRQKDAFKSAADRWVRVIVGDLPSVMIGGEVIDDLLIFAQAKAIDGGGTSEGNILGMAGPRDQRPRNAGSAAFLPATGEMTFDSFDLRQMERDGTLNDVITHEMGHVLGIGTIWTDKGLLRGANTRNPAFRGRAAMTEFGVLRGGRTVGVPVENTGGPGTRDGHWRNSVFRTELMTGFVDVGGNPLSRLTVASLQDLGYVVDMNAAEPFSLPNLAALAERGVLAAAIEAPVNRGMMLPTIPTVLPEDSLQ